MADVTIRPTKNGPLIIEGPVDLFDTDGNQVSLDKPRIALCRCGDRQYAAGAVDRSVEGQLAEEHDFRNMAALDDTGGRQDAERDRKIERGAGFADIGRCEVDGDPVRWELEPRVADRAPDAIAALAHTRVG